MRSESLYLLGVIFLLTVALPGISPASGDEIGEAWLGTYTMEVKEDEQEIYDMLKEMGVAWPSITFKEDGTIFLVKAQGEGRGTYTVEGSKVTLTMTEYNGQPPPGRLAEPKIGEFQDNYRVLLLKGPRGERFLKQK